MNSEFNDDQLGPAMLITQIQPEGADAIPIEADHRTNRRVLEVRKVRNLIRGIFRARPQRGDNILMFVRWDRDYYPQPPISFDFHLENHMWAAWVYLGSDGEPTTDYEIIVARVSADLNVATTQYVRVYQATGQWVGLLLDPEPSGFERLVSLNVRRIGS
jgi:hypothetical protein